MAVFDRRIKHKNGTVSVMRYITWYLPGSGTAVTRSLGPASKITKTRAKAILAKENADAKKNKHGSDDPKLSEYVEQYIKYARDIRQKRSWQRDQISLEAFKDDYLRYIREEMGDKQGNEKNLSLVKKYIGKVGNLRNIINCLGNSVLVQRWVAKALVGLEDADGKPKEDIENKKVEGKLVNSDLKEHYEGLKKKRGAGWGYLGMAMNNDALQTLDV